MGDFAVTDDFNPVTDTWRSIWEAYAMTDPRSTVDPSVAVERHRKWCAEEAKIINKEKASD